VGEIGSFANEVDALTATLHTLASGSSGNAAVVSCGGVHILLDAGISCRRIVTGLRALGLEPEALSAVLITHTHSDHIGGLDTFVRHYDVPICASRRTCTGLERRVAGIGERLRVLEEEASFGALTVTPFPTSHDAPGSQGYRVGDVGILTDTGYVTPEAEEVLLGVPLLVLEANHDVEMLRSGPYPYPLKRRILGDGGHLSNDAAAAFARECALAGTREIVLAHLSQENNTPAAALNTVGMALEGLDVTLSAAPRDTMSRRYETEAVSCRR